jgi:sulfoxide reductase heme-binding subunit YedZ
VALIPAAWLFYKALSGAAGPDPVRVLEHGLGSDALKFLIASLAVTPLRERAGINLLRFRRMLGLTAFYYVALHFLAWLVFDRQLAFAAILADLTKRTYIIVGMVSLLLLIPLAVTSHDAMVRRLGALNWRRLHKLAYGAAALAALHYLWLVKTWTTEPLAYALAIALLLAYRLLPKPAPAGGRRQKAAA